jgi:hypothetical protein
MTVTPASIHVALLSHTNVGKTTLARTLLRKDIGAVIDRAHVTEVAEAHVAMRTAAGDELVLWDTPGFGDSARLVRRLEQSGNPLGWFLSQVWDRFADRPFWSSQQALRAARESADVLLYVVNATEEPEAAGYAAPELRIVSWLDKPALVLVNQLGTRGDAARDSQVVSRWQAAVAALDSGVAVRVLSFDAFARCWLQEHELLAAIEPCVDEARRPAFARIVAAWRERDAAILGRSASVLAVQLATLASDAEAAVESTLPDKARQFFDLIRGRGDAPAASEARARAALVQRLDDGVRASTTGLVELHGLAGSAGEQVLQTMGAEFDTRRAVDTDRATLLGGLVSGALSGVAADLAAGGLTFGAGALLGGVAGALGARKLTQIYNAERGETASTVRWSSAFLESRLESALVRYLAVAHFGRGRGEFRTGEPPGRWLEVVRASLGPAAGRAGLWERLRSSSDATAELATLVERALLETLTRLYPEAARAFMTSQQEGASRAVPGRRS